jgi:hypothetical protein
VAWGQKITNLYMEIPDLNEEIFVSTTLWSEATQEEKVTNKIRESRHLKLNCVSKGANSHG